MAGIHETIVICFQNKKETPVAPYFCDPSKRLEIEVRTCNENPCPPRWNVSDFTECSKSCGGGIQTRTVQCIQEVAHGDNNIITLAETACPQPPPRAQQFCNVIDCPTEWQTSPWTKVGHLHMLLQLPKNSPSRLVFAKVWIRLSLQKSPLPATPFSRATDRQT